MREDVKDTRERYVKTVRDMQQTENARIAPARMWDARQVGWNEGRIKRHKQEIQPALTRRTFLMR